ncbi:flavin reductase family protein [Paenibacillus sp. LK1]|uniref:flavin reductase family protein n=1 Tax=Paenibacillus sp. LK1 TaxID=2053014 RepID=UPI000C19D818|nr:flavin reductase family protein [Paenibacillus sp. LK1]PIH61386.1 flavin oxidoreductase [Paenibacillus sp. LK1]
MRKPIDEPMFYSYPGMVAVVTSRHKGIQNVMASGWHTYIGSSPGIYGISLRKETYSYELIEQSGVFGVHFLPGHHSEWIQAAGTFSGRDTDKFSKFGITYEEGIKVNVPILTEAYFAYECKVIDIKTYGDHEWIAGEVVQRYQDPEYFLENGMVNLDKLQIPMYVGRSSYRILDGSAKEKVHPFYL